jgi:hypothetical protein
MCIHKLWAAANLRMNYDVGDDDQRPSPRSLTKCTAKTKHTLPGYTSSGSEAKTKQQRRFVPEKESSIANSREVDAIDTVSSLCFSLC